MKNKQCPNTVFSKSKRNFARFLIMAKTAGLRYAISKSFEQIKKIRPKNTVCEDSELLLQKTAPADAVDILVSQFYDAQGNCVYAGGAERYVADLCGIIRRNGKIPRVIQPAGLSFQKDYKGIQITGVPSAINDNGADFFGRYAAGSNRAETVIVSPFDMAVCKLDARVIGISHSVNWDHFTNSLASYNPSRHRHILKTLSNMNMCVCVDTNFINWTRTFDYSLSRKLKFVPNYFDENIFKAENKSFDDERIEILFPRRLHNCCGFGIALSAGKRLIEKYKNVSFKFAGKPEPALIPVIEKHKKMFGEDKISFTQYDMEDMNNPYKTSQIAIMPTVSSEGTSLSCIEAMATNNAVIASNVGGLTNLIIDGYNGILISPDEKELFSALETLINNRELRRELAGNALAVSRAFTKTKWETAWQKILLSGH